MNNYNILGLPLNEGLIHLRRISDKKIALKETLSNKNGFKTLISEARILKCTETKETITIVFSYF